MPRWEHFEHGADIGVRGVADSKAEAFAQAALAMTAAVTNPAAVRSLDAVEIHRESSDDERLLVEWLNALVHEMATRRMLFSKFDVRMENGRLSAQAWGEGIDRERHHPAVEVKGATLTSARVARHGDGWLAQTVIDV
jgi:SHS2 domain-containing protein